VATISFWDHEISAQGWSANGYPEALKKLGDLLDGVPYVKTFEVIGSTWPSLTPANGEAGNLLREPGRGRGFRTFETNA